MDPNRRSISSCKHPAMKKEMGKKILQLQLKCSVKVIQKSLWSPPPLLPNSRIFQYLLSTSPRVDTWQQHRHLLPTPPPGHLEKISTICPGGGRGVGPARLEFFGFFCPNLQKKLAFFDVACPTAGGAYSNKKFSVHVTTYTHTTNTNIIRSQTHSECE